MTATPARVEPGILPCPFCADGEHQEVIRDPRDQWLAWYVVICLADGCHALGPAKRTEAEAIAAWNQRANNHAPLLAALEHVTECLVTELGNLADEDDIEDDDLAATLGQDCARQIIAARLRIKQARQAIAAAKSGGEG